MTHIFSVTNNICYRCKDCPPTRLSFCITCKSNSSEDNFRFSSNPFPSTLESLLVEITDSRPERSCVYFKVGEENVLLNVVKKNLMLASPTIVDILKENSKLKSECDFIIVNSIGETAYRDADCSNIRIPRCHPYLFKVFLSLMDEEGHAYVTVNRVLKTLNLTVQQVVHLIDCARFFETKSIEYFLTRSVNHYIARNPNFWDTNRFFMFSRRNIKVLFSSDILSVKEVDRVQQAYIWALVKCKKREVSRNTANVKCLLGDCLYHIKLHEMSSHEFLKVVASKNLISSSDKAFIYKYITQGERNEDDDDNESFTEVTMSDEETPKEETPGTVQTGYKICRKNQEIFWQRAAMPKVYHTQACLHGGHFLGYERDPKFCYQSFATEVTIQIMAISFHGPNELVKEGIARITVEPFLWKKDTWVSMGITEKEVWEREDKKTKFRLNTPVLLEQIPLDANFMTKQQSFCIFKYNIRRQERRYTVAEKARLQAWQFRRDTGDYHEYQMIDNGFNLLIRCHEARVDVAELHYLVP